MPENTNQNKDVAASENTQTSSPNPSNTFSQSDQSTQSDWDKENKKNMQRSSQGTSKQGEWEDGEGTSENVDSGESEMQNPQAGTTQNRQGSISQRKGSESSGMNAFNRKWYRETVNLSKTKVYKNQTKTCQKNNVYLLPQ